MKNFTRKLTALILSIMMLMSIAPSMGFAAEAENAVLNTLQNTLYKLSTDKELNVGYIGGSITVGANATNVNTDSYRALTTSWLKEKFPEAAITEINVSTGGTGSQYGLWRANTDLKLGTENQPDLTFIEYAVNDAYDKQSKAQASFYMESLVNKLYAANPNMDIVILLSTDVNKRNEDNVFPQLVAHREVAQRYGIPYIENGYKLYNEIYAAKKK